jgi:hypothetical protein
MSCRDSDLVYLRSMFPTSSNIELDLLRLKLIVMDTKGIVGEDIFEVRPENLEEYLKQYQLWEILKS